MDAYIIAVVIYVGFLIGIGIYKSRGVKTQDDFMVAGRRTSTWFLIGSLVSTWIGSGSLFGGAGLAFRTGFSQLWMSAGAWAGIIIVYFLAHRVRRISQYTVSDILEKRYNATARVLGTITIIIAYLTIAGYQFRGAGRLLNILLGIDPLIGGAIACAIVIFFTVVAGMVSIMSIDLFNGIVKTLALFIALPLIVAAVGGMEQISSLPADRFEVFGTNDYKKVGDSWPVNPEAMARGMAARSKTAGDPRREAADARAEIASLGARQDKLARLVTKGLVPDDLGERQLAEIARLRAAATERLAAIEARAETAARAKEHAADIAAAAKLIREGIADGSFASWRHAVELLFPRRPGTWIRVRPDGEIQTHGLLRLRTDNPGSATSASPSP